MAGSEECFRNFFFISVNTNKWLQRSLQRENLTFSCWTPILQKRSAHQWNLAHSGHWTWWWFNGREQEKQEKCVIKCLKVTLDNSSSDCSVLVLAPGSSSGLSLSSSVICLAAPIVSSYDFVKYKAAGPKFSVLHFCPIFLEILGISIQMALSELGQISNFSRGRTPFLELKHYYLRKSLTCS